MLCNDKHDATHLLNECADLTNGKEMFHIYLFQLLFL